MGHIRVMLAVLALGTLPAAAIDPAALETAGQYKAGKLVAIEDVATFMQLGERWCYNEAGGACGWAEIYLDVDAESARYETSGRWDADTEVTNLGVGTFSEAGQLCDSATPIFDSLRARLTSDGADLAGRDLDRVRKDWIASRTTNAEQAPLCYDYQFGGLDENAETITLTQRVWRDGATDPAENDPVTIHFDPATASALFIAP